MIGFMPCIFERERERKAREVADLSAHERINWWLRRCLIDGSLRGVNKDRVREVFLRLYQREHLLSTDWLYLNYEVSKLRRDDASVVFLVVTHFLVIRIVLKSIEYFL